MALSTHLRLLDSCIANLCWRSLFLCFPLCLLFSSAAASSLDRIFEDPLSTLLQIELEARGKRLSPLDDLGDQRSFAIVQHRLPPQ